MDRPVLNTIRSILKFKDFATISEISKLAEIKQRDVLAIINHNGHMVWRDRKSGRITNVDPRSVLRKQLTESDAYYFPDTYGVWSVEGRCLRFNGHDELREKITQSAAVGALGDSRTEYHVMDTPENRAALEANGLRLWSESEVDDRLWVEPVHDHNAEECA